MAFSGALVILTTSLLYNNCSGFKTLGSVGSGKSDSTSETPSTSRLPNNYESGDASWVTDSPYFFGVLESIRGDVVFGWACMIGKNEAVGITLKADDAVVAEFVTSVNSESHLSDSVHCANSFRKHRFIYRFSPAQMTSLSGKVLTVFAHHQSNPDEKIRISPKRTTAYIGERPVWYSRLPPGYVGSPLGAAVTPTVAGKWETVIMNSDTSLSLSGWACVPASTNSVAIAVLTETNVVVRVFETTLSATSSENAVTTACQSPSLLRRRFSVRIEPLVVARFAYKKIHLSMTEPFVSGIFYGNLLRPDGSSEFLIDPSAVTPSSTGGTGGNNGNSGAGTNSICSARVNTESCQTTAVCPGGATFDMGKTNVSIKYNITAEAGDDPIAITTSNASGDTGYTLNQITGISFICMPSSAPGAAAGAVVWDRILVNTACAVTQNLTANSPLCKPLTCSLCAAAGLNYGCVAYTNQATNPYGYGGLTQIDTGLAGYCRLWPVSGSDEGDGDHHGGAEAPSEGTDSSGGDGFSDSDSE